MNAGAAVLNDNPVDQLRDVVALRLEWRRYLFAKLFLALFFLAIVAGINVIVDPYLRFGTARTKWVSQHRPAAIRQVKMAKAYGVERKRYQTIFLGNSRVDVGLNPQSNQVPEVLKPAYNLGQPGTGTAVALRYLEHVSATQSPGTVVLGVDFLNFLRDPSKQASQKDDDSEEPSNSAAFRRLKRIDDNWFARDLLQQQIMDLLASTLSLSALRDSAATVLAQRDPNAADVSDDGFNSGNAFRTLIRNEGQAALFQQKNVEYVSKCLNRQAPSSDSTELQAIERLLEHCRQYGIEAVMFIHPYHADILEIFDATGRWNDFEEWKRQLAVIGSKYSVPVWDFAGYSEYNCEMPPEPSDRRTVMQWYWESGHYRATLGDKMFAEMFLTKPKITSLGQTITPDNLSAHLSRIREEQRAYRQSATQRATAILTLIPQNVAGAK